MNSLYKTTSVVSLSLLVFWERKVTNSSLTYPNFFKPFFYFPPPSTQPQRIPNSPYSRSGRKGTSSFHFTNIRSKFFSLFRAKCHINPERTGPDSLFRKTICRVGLSSRPIVRPTRPLVFGNFFSRPAVQNRDESCSSHLHRDLYI